MTRVAIVGAGYTAREHARAFRAIDHVTIAGIQSRTRERAEALAREYGIERVCDSISALYEDTHADLVVVTVPVALMDEVSRTAFRHPWTVLLEKPAGCCLAEAEELAAAASARGGRVFVALNRRMYSSTRAVRTDLAADEERRYVRVQDQQDQAAALRAGHPQLVVANWMFANSIHLVDYLRMFCRGAVTSVTPVMAWDAKAPGVVVAKATFDSGDVGIYEGIWNGPGPWAVTISTPARRWEMRPLEEASRQLRGTRQVVAAEISTEDREFKPGFLLQARQAVAASRGQATELATIGDALESMRLVQAIFFPSCL